MNDLDETFQVDTVLNMIASKGINPIAQFVRNKDISIELRNSLGHMFEQLIRTEAIRKGAGKDIVRAMRTLHVTDSRELDWDSAEYVAVDNVPIHSLLDRVYYKKYTFDLATNSLSPHVLDMSIEDAFGSAERVQLHDSEGRVVTLLSNYRLESNHIRLTDAHDNVVLVDGKENLAGDFEPYADKRYQLTTRARKSNMRKNDPLFFFSNDYTHEDSQMLCYAPTSLNVTENAEFILNTLRLLKRTSNRSTDPFSCFIFKKTCQYDVGSLTDYSEDEKTSIYAEFFVKIIKSQAEIYEHTDKFGSNAATHRLGPQHKHHVHALRR